MNKKLNKIHFQIQTSFLHWNSSHNYLQPADSWDHQSSTLFVFKVFVLLSSITSKSLFGIFNLKTQQFVVSFILLFWDHLFQWEYDDFVLIKPSEKNVSSGDGKVEYKNDMYCTVLF